jgi:hypothetical protein
MATSTSETILTGHPASPGIMSKNLKELPGCAAGGASVIHVLRGLRYARCAMHTLLSDLEEFVWDHRPHGPLTGDATDPTDQGYLITVACPCGVTFMRWVAPVDAALDLLLADLRARLN